MKKNGQSILKLDLTYAGLCYIFAVFLALIGVILAIAKAPETEFAILLAGIFMILSRVG